MKLRILTLMLLFVTSSIIAQQTEDASLFTNGKSTVRVPQSPETGTLGRFGSIPVGSSTGQMSYSIPFYNISVDGNSWPINLNYNYGGFILEGKPSLNGLGWSMMSNGAVSREVRGLPDEHNFGYYSNTIVDGGQKMKDLVYSYFDNSEGLENWGYLTMNKFLNGQYDSEVDKYTVNVGGLHFSFKVGLDQQPVYLSKHANIVDIVCGEYQLRMQTLETT